MVKLNLFTQHPKENEMTYLQHMAYALMLARKTFGCAIASIIHAFLPFLFLDHTSKTIMQLNNDFAKRIENKKKIKKTQVNIPFQKRNHTESFVNY
jgi:hypothetical protein